MDAFSLLTLLGGLAFFIYGITVMSSGLQLVSGNRFKNILKMATDKKIKGLSLGAVLTILMQSSSALTVMLVSLVNASALSLENTVAIICGSNIGTTLTAWIFSLVGIESNNFFARLLNPENFSPIFALTGVIILLVSKSKILKNVGQILIGFAILMFGMTLMSDSVETLKQSSLFEGVLIAFKNPIISLFTAAIFTGIIQSSAASIAILQSLSLTGSVTYGMALPIVMGQNIGTCVTALISCFGVNKNARRVAVIHILFNILGSVVFLSLYYFLNSVFRFNFTTEKITPAGIAFLHTAFNIATTCVLLPFSKGLVFLSKIIIKDKNHH